MLCAALRAGPCAPRWPAESWARPNTRLFDPGVELLRGLGALIPRRPREFRDRVAGHADLALDYIVDAAPDHGTTSWASALRDVEARLGSATAILEEPALRDVEGETRRILRRVHDEYPRGAQWPADSLMARCCYLVCRLLEPALVIETGVAYGVSSAFALTALRENGHGALHSVDLPPLRREAEKFWGIAVPEELRERWTLHRGSSATVLPRLLEEIPKIDLFVHDSLHTQRNMRREFETVWPRLRTGGVIIADDVERNRAFGELQQRHPPLWRVVSDRETSPLHGKAAPVVFGIAVK
jgi:predicted O-methyltransferase YrrM